MEKTALQQLIDKWEREKGSYIPNAPIFQCFIDDAKAMLEKEKEQMMQCYEDGYNRVVKLIEDATQKNLNL